MAAERDAVLAGLAAAGRPVPTGDSGTTGSDTAPGTGAGETGRRVSRDGGVGRATGDSRAGTGALRAGGPLVFGAPSASDVAPHPSPAGTATATATATGSSGPGPTPAPAPVAVEAVVAGVGPAAAAAATADALARARAEGRPFDLVLCAGIAGGLTGRAPLGSVVVASRILAADLGAETPDGFADVTELGFGTVAHDPPARLAAEVAGAAGALLAPVLTVSTVTGTVERAAELAARHPTAGAEAMEGFGVAEAAVRAGVPVLEVRAVSNPVGPRDRAAWRIPEALRALADACAAAAHPLLAAAHPDGGRRTPRPGRPAPGTPS
ncbi:futalosine hydrolase [Streptomyces sp. ST2-7A]|uniref:futalosine hydrolase n=1 Tax=Streptomyces sp. ST2-7A TaxID=2907214 RepID=UPI001F386A42|nr:futalosine hydrolase [Streptomyces sp. ST2-7A]